MNDPIVPAPTNLDWWSSFNQATATKAERTQFAEWRARYYEYALTHQKIDVGELECLFVQDFLNWDVDQLDGLGNSTVCHIQDLSTRLSVF